MSQFANRDLLEDLPENEPWPPVPPDVDTATIEVETPELSVTGNSMLYRIKGHPSKVYKFRGEFREYQLQEAAGDCAIPVRGKVLGKPRIGNGEIFFYGFMMDLATPILTIPPPTILLPTIPPPTPLPPTLPPTTLLPPTLPPTTLLPTTLSPTTLPPTTLPPTTLLPTTLLPTTLPPRALPPTTLSPSQRRDIMHQMINTVQRLHAKRIVHGDMKLENMLLDSQGKLRLCDFGEGRYMDEDEHVWDGNSTMHFESPNRLLREQQFGRDPPPPTIEDDLYGLGLSIWQLYTGKIPHGDIAGDDLELKERQRNGETVNVAAVDDQEARGIITSLLRKGGARI